MNEQIDLKDKKILHQLDINARQTNAQIAKKVGLSKEVVNYRIKRLEKEEYISGYHTIINFWKLGYQTIRVYLKFIDITPQDEEKLLEWLTKQSKVLFILKTEGKFDVGFGVIVKDIAEFDNFYREITDNWRLFISDEQFSFYTAIHHFNRSYLLENKSESSIIIKDDKLISHDERDIEILKIISDNARITLLDLSNKLKMAPRTVSYRIKRLEKNKVVVNYRMILNTKKLHYEYYKLDIKLRDTKVLDKIISFCKTNQNIVFLIRTLGGADIELGIEVSHREKLDSLIQDLRNTFPEIRDMSSMNLLGYKKYVYFLK